ncbi:MAG: radical SAM protein [Lentisphaeria bacterium]|nr:radical SAM protein [Lentisphaeria bacterium]
MTNRCFCCARNCGIDRSSGKSFCGETETVRIARAALHHWEEPCISGTNGSGTVFFSGCNLRCVYCQNYDISSCSKGFEITVERLREIYFELIGQGAHNINFVTPSHFTEGILKSLENIELPVPVVFNTNGYDSAANLKRFENKVQIYLPDLKYAENDLAIRFSHAPHYFESACEAIDEMFRQRGPYVIDDDGILISGVVIRHLILPGHLENSKKVIDYVARRFKSGEVLFSLMRQYTPCGKVAEFPELQRTLSDEEYEEVQDYLFESGIEDGFLQDSESASGDFIPSFNGEGVLKES